KKSRGRWNAPDTCSEADASAGSIRIAASGCSNARWQIAKSRRWRRGETSTWECNDQLPRSRDRRKDPAGDRRARHQPPDLLPAELLLPGRPRDVLHLLRHRRGTVVRGVARSEEHTSELQ